MPRRRAENRPNISIPRFRAGKHVVACASHTVYYGSAEIFAHALIESGVHIACNFSYGRVSGVKLSDNALIVRLNEIDAALGEIFMKRAEKPFERRIIGLYYDSAVGCAIKNVFELFVQFAVFFYSEPITGKRMLRSHTTHIALHFVHSRFESAGKTVGVGVKRRERAAMHKRYHLVAAGIYRALKSRHVRPHIVDKRPLHRNVFACKFAALFDKTVAVYAYLHGVSAAPTQIFEDFGINARYAKKQPSSSRFSQIRPVEYIHVPSAAIHPMLLSAA